MVIFTFLCSVVLFYCFVSYPGKFWEELWHTNVTNILPLLITRVHLWSESMYLRYWNIFKLNWVRGATVYFVQGPEYGCHNFLCSCVWGLKLVLYSLKALLSLYVILQWILKGKSFFPLLEPSGIEFIRDKTKCEIQIILWWSQAGIRHTVYEMSGLSIVVS